MKLTLSTYSNDGCYTDVQVAQVGFNCPYLLKIKWRRYTLTIYRRKHPLLCVSKDNSDEPRGGDMPDWAEWVLWEDSPMRFKWWRAERTKGT